MAKFIPESLSAVASFFGKEGESADGPASAAVPKFTGGAPSKRHLGLGATPTKSGAEQREDATEAKFIRVGKRRRHADSDDDDDDGEVLSDAGSDDGGGGDGGRTSTILAKCLTDRAAEVAPLPTKKKKKKKKKKGKNVEDDTADGGDAGGATHDDGAEPPRGDDGAAQNAPAPAFPPRGDGARGGFPLAPFPKKKKKRSRQKNIRKDNRRAEEKPEHLRIVPGYGGHPITPETRARLGIPKEGRVGRGAAAAAASKGEGAR
eukprot:CAMPEP_0194265208 /NCGR_PEP_ID=MMETSP0169-20130528/533_1 /TAXON_ID=218684 /ORGANISM="Corethron pennatum, Strain L29A3" /LENGTH=261 /DNA_ID=CAMNT_0039005631 /DNA_START=83 /DNA_END=864 /DNA_ORIENTATION=+